MLAVSIRTANLFLLLGLTFILIFVDVYKLLVILLSRGLTMILLLVSIERAWFIKSLIRPVPYGS